MLDPVSRPAKRPKRTIYYGPNYAGGFMLEAADGVLFGRREHPEFPITDELRSAAVSSMAAVCRAVIEHTARWGNPETDTPSTWSCVAWEHRRHAEAVLALVTVPALDLSALRTALDAWKAYGR
jgi:hypothetical protein